MAQTGTPPPLGSQLGVGGSRRSRGSPGKTPKGKEPGAAEAAPTRVAAEVARSRARSCRRCHRSCDRCVTAAASRGWQGSQRPKTPQNPPPPTRGTPEQRTRGWGTKPHPPTVSPCHLRDPPKQQLGHPKGSGTPQRPPMGTETPPNSSPRAQGPLKDPPHGPQTPPGTPPKFIWCPPRAQEPPMDPPARGGTMGPPPLDPDRASPTPPLCADSAIPAGAARTRG